MPRSRLTGDLDDALPLTVQPPQQLPVSWDGVPVSWGPWEHQVPLVACPPIPSCGSLEPSMVARGRTQLDLGALLVAYRCTACRLDTVWDARADQHWTLDDSDYGPDGSVEP